LAVFVLAVIFRAGAVESSTIDQKRSELDQIQSQINYYENLAQQKENQIGSLTAQIKKMNAEIKVTELNIQRTQMKINITELEIAKTKAEIKQKEKELAYQKSVLNEALRVIYEEGNAGFLESFLKAGTLSDLIDRSEYLDTVENKIEVTMAKIAEIKADLLAKKKDLDSKNADLHSLLVEHQESRDGLLVQKSAKNSLLSETQGQKAAYSRLVSKKQKEYEQSNAELKRLEEALNGGNGGGGGGYSVPFWPMYGYISVGFGACGCQAYFCGRCHTGVDIVAPFGSSIRAAKSGKVISTNDGCADYGSYSCGGGYGNNVRVRFDDGYVSIYGHMKRGSVRVHTGQQVTGGATVLGSEGSSGFSTGAHLHFEIRTSDWGTPVRPGLP
jgi:murein DD-endopeptidase MepM/ murein hydrolase activator NlpD